MPERIGLRAARASVLVTALTLAAQAAAFVTQIVIAAVFGAGREMDAFVAASTLPQYVLSVLVSILGAVFIPVVLEYRASGREDDARTVIQGMSLVVVAFLLVLALAGMLASAPLLRATTPGLGAEGVLRAALLALILWPSIIAAGLASLLTGAHQADRQFAWPATVPLLGALANLVIVALTVRRFGVAGVAVASTASAALQVALLWRRSGAGGMLRAWSAVRHPGVISVLRLLWPLVISGLITRWTPVVDRYVASDLPQGSISHLAYAFRVVTLLAMLVSTGITTVLYPILVEAFAKKDESEFRVAGARGFGVMWAVATPVSAFVFALAEPGVHIVFQRGAFGPDDARVVARLLQVYALALPMMCVGSVTSRMFYARKATRTVAIGSVIEALAYLVYTPMLASRWGVMGVAAAYGTYFYVSVFWQLLLLWVPEGRAPGWMLGRSILRTTLAATAAGVLAWWCTRIQMVSALQFAVGGLVGVASFVGIMLVFGSSELDLMKRLIKDVASGSARKVDSTLEAPPPTVP